MSSKNNSSISKILMAGAAFSALSVGTAAAQSSDEIIVTATKRAQTLQEVPVAVSVVDAEVIEDAQIIDIIDLQSTVSSLRVTQQQNSSQTNFVIRGFGNGANNPGIEPSVGVFVDGVYRSRSAAAILDLPTLERAEILRGPQSTLFGKNVSAGAISLTTKAPSYDWEGSVEATYGNLDTVRFRGTLSGPISDTLAFRISGSTNNRDGVYTNVVNGEDNINERNRWAVRGQLLWEPTDYLSFRAIGDYNKIDEVCCGAIFIETGPITTGVIRDALGGVIPPSTNPDDRLVAVDQNPDNQLEGKGISLQADWDLGFATLTSITSYREQSDFNNTDVDFTSVDLATQPQTAEYETFTQELRLAGEFESGIGVFNWLAGGFLFDETVNFQQQTTFGDAFRAFGDVQLAQLGTNFLEVEGSTQLAAALTSGPTALFPEYLPATGAQAIPFGAGFASGTGFTGNYTLENRSYSLFFQTDWDITDRLTLTGGVSYVNDRKEAVGDVVQTEPFQNLILSQFATSGNAFVAANIFGGLIGEAFNPADPTAFFVAAQTLAATDPTTFGTLRQAAVDNANLALGADPTLNPLLPFTALGALQFIPFQTPFPMGTMRDDEISLLDDGFAVDDAINVTARIAYDVTDNLNVYFSYATGYKAPAVNLSQDAQPPTLAPDGNAVGRFALGEDVTVYEIGLKANFDRGFLNVALFDQTITDFQSNTFTGTGFQFENSGEQSVLGFEVEGAYSPVDPLLLTFGLTYLDPNFDSFIAAACPTAGFAPISDPAILAECAPANVTRFDATGTRPSGIHPVSLTTAATYTHELANGSTLTPRIEYIYESEASLFSFGDGTEPTRKVSQINANIEFATENGFSVNLWGRNLNDDDALITFFTSVAQAGSFNAYVTTPRTYGISVRKKF